MTIKKTLLASVITLTMISGMAHADSIAGAMTELEAITPNMSQAEINQKIERFIERAPKGTSIANVLLDFPLAHYVPVATQPVQETPHLDSNATDTERQAAQQAAEKIAAYRHNNPEGIPTHQIGAATHLDGEHQAPVTPHLDAPVIDRSSHLDSNATDTERQAAQQAAENMLAYRHNNPEGIPTHQIGAATHLDGEHQAPVTPHLDTPVIDRSSHLDSNATDAERQAAQQAAENMLAYRHNNPEGIPTHQIGAATHLDGEHQAPVTPHLDAPVIDRSSHLDSNVTDAERQAAQQAAEKIAAYRHNNPEGIPTHQIGAATHLDGEHQAPVTPHLDAPVIDRSSHLDRNATDAERQAAQQAAENMLAYRHNNPEGIPTHQIGAATHLDGEHQTPVTPHLDAPVIDRSSHLDSNATDAERQAAQQAAEKIAAYRHNNPEGIPTHQIGAATHLDGEHQAPVTPHLDAPVIDRSSHLDSNATDTERQAAQQTAEKIAAYRHNNPEGIPTHQIGAATHLDGEHQAPVTPHLDAPVIDRSSHLDSNVTDAERQAAQQAAENMLAYRHNNPEGIPTHQIGAATHLDGEHQAPVTPHLDAPVIDRSSHLDSNATDAERQAAQQAAEKIAAYRHNNPEGNPTHQTGPATHLDGTHQTPVTPHLDGQHNVAQTLSLAKAHQNDRHKLANAAAPQDGINGKDGTDGKDADMTQVNANTAGLRSMRTEQTAQSHDIKQNGANIAGNQAHIASNTAAINQNSQDIANNRKDIDENSKNIKRVGAMAQAVSSLHYNRNESGYAVAAGEYDGETSIAGGMQFSTSDNSAVTVQMSWDGNAAGAGVGFHSNF